MTRDDIIRMAREAGIYPANHETISMLERFAALVAAAEREARQAAQVQNEELKARIARVGLEGNLAKAKAVKAEREACADIADCWIGVDKTAGEACDEIARDIRARGAA